MKVFVFVLTVLSSIGIALGTTSSANAFSDHEVVFAYGKTEAPGTLGDLQVFCPSGKKVLSGGYSSASDISSKISG